MNRVYPVEVGMFPLELRMILKTIRRLQQTEYKATPKRVAGFTYLGSVSPTAIVYGGGKLPLPSAPVVEGGEVPHSEWPGPGRARGEDHHPVGEIDRFVDTVSDE